MVGTRNAAFAEESAEVEVLLAEAKKFEEISKKMQASIARMTASGDALSKAMGPAYSSTGHLHVINRSMQIDFPVIRSLLTPMSQT